jgi:tetratricopeptide (TPR) repeat protein
MHRHSSRFGSASFLRRSAAGALGGLLWGFTFFGATPSSAQSLPAADDLYEAALQEAHRAETAGDLSTAIRVLNGILPRYPQDVELPLQLGWLLYRSNLFGEAEHSYRMAIARGAGDGKAELGLAYSLLRLGHCDEAAPRFLSLLTAGRAPAGAAEGLRQCYKLLAAPPPPVLPPLPRLWVQPQFSQGVYLYGGSSQVRNTVASKVQLEALLYGHYYLAAAFRYSHYAAPQGTLSSWSQYEVYADAGYSALRGGLTLHYAVVDDESGTSGTVHHLGLTARYSPALTAGGPAIGDAYLRLSASLYHGAPVLRGELAFRLPLYAGLSLRPAGAVQWTAAETFRTLSLSLGYDHPRFSLWAGGKYGDEFRAAYLDYQFIYNAQSRTAYGFLAGAAVRPGGHVTLLFNYGYDDLKWTAATPATESTVHYLTFSIAKEF